MRHGAEQRDAPTHAGQHVGGAAEAGEVAGARRQQPGLGAVGAAQAEIHQQFARRRQPHARRLGGDQGLELQQVDEARLDQLRLRQRRDDAQDRLVGKNTVPSGMACTSPVKRRSGSESTKRLVKAPAAGQPVQLLGGEAQVFEKIQHLFQPRRHQEIAPGRQLAHEELEHRRVRPCPGRNRPAAW